MSENNIGSQQPMKPLSNNFMRSKGLGTPSSAKTGLDTPKTKMCGMSDSEKKPKISGKVCTYEKTEKKL